MFNEKVFGYIELPDLMEEDELLVCIEKYKQGDRVARYQLINNYLKFVIYVAKMYMEKCNYLKVEYDDLVMAGMEGLIKAIDSFDFNFNVKLLTYINRCINNQMLMYLRKFKKFNLEVSIEECIVVKSSNDELKIELFLGDNNLDPALEYIKQLEKDRIKEIIESLSEKDKEYIKLRFGFYDDIIYTQEEISQIFGVSQSYVSRKIRKLTRKLKERFKEEDIYY